jgi:hypothetical protein
MALLDEAVMAITAHEVSASSWVITPHRPRTASSDTNTPSDLAVIPCRCRFDHGRAGGI